MRVLIGPMARLAGKQGIQRLLEWAPPDMKNTNVIHCVENWPALLEAVRIGVEDPTDGYDLFVAEFGLPGSPEFAELASIDPVIAVLDVDFDQGTHRPFNVRNAKVHLLVEWLTRKGGLRTDPDAMAVLIGDQGEDEYEAPVTEAEAEPADEAPPEVLELEAQAEAPRLGAAFRPRLVATGDSLPRDGDAQLDDLARWLELRLALMLSPSSAELVSLDVPGWGINAQRARALLGQDFAELPHAELLRRWEDVDARLHGHVEAARHRPRDGTLGSICDAFGLDEIDRQVLWIALAPDIAGNLAQATGFLNDDLSLRRPTLSLVAQMVDGAGPPWKLQQRLAGHESLARFRLVAAVPADPLTPESLVALRAPADLVAMLRGGRADAADDATLFEPAGSARDFDEHLAPVQWAVLRPEGKRPVVHLHAPVSEASWLARQLASVEHRTLVGDLRPAAGLELPAVLDKLLSFGRAARAADAVLVVAGLDEQVEATRDELIRCLIQDLAPCLKLLVVQGMRTAPTALRGAAGGITEISRPRPTRAERESIWSDAAAGRGLVLSGKNARDLAATFAFDRSQAEAAISLAIGSGTVEPPNESALRDAARLVSRASAPPSVTRIETKQGWDDIILPVSVKAELKSIVTQVRHGATVWEDWGFGTRIPYGQAMIALLAGPSGTGKTMAAQIIAGELGAALFQVDLAKTVSKYIGETEKALDRIFEAAEAASAVLLFDEADALFGKRSEIHDAHDRYANIEVNFLLQRIEEHLAPVLLTTNRKANIDSAFLRRLNKVVDFPMPDEEQRALIWKSMLPPDDEAPVADDVDLTAFRQLPLSGGSIANTVLAAAFMGAEDGGVIRMRHLVAAARGELAKSGMQSAGRSLTHLIESARSGAKS